jgi:epoxyqueuosine reductase QueG
MKEKIRSIFLSLGADICGFANIDRFSEAPAGFSPSDVYTECKSVIVIAKALPKGLSKVSPRIIYNQFNNVGLAEVDRISYLGASEIEREFGCTAVPVPSDGPYDYWDEEKLEGRGTISMKHAAMLAGLGTLGKSTMLINSKYGNMINIGVVLTDIDLESDPPAEEMCKKGCSLCINSCPVKALDGVTANQTLCRPHAYGTNARGFDVVNCNVCRVVCPRAYGKR